MPIQRSVLANLESGRRTTVNLAELLVLAAALGVPPVTLLFPAGYVRDVEVLPGVRKDPVVATDWFVGESFLDDASAKTGARTGLSRARQHQRLVSKLRGSIRMRETAREDFASKSGHGWAAQRFQELQAMAQAVVVEMESLVSTKEENLDRWNELTRERTELSDEIARLANSAYAYNYARDRADRAELNVHRAEERLRAYRSGLRSAGMIPPSLPPDVAYVEPEGATEDPLWGTYPKGVGWRGAHEHLINRERAEVDRATSYSDLADEGEDDSGVSSATQDEIVQGIPNVFATEAFVDLLAEKIARQVKRLSEVEGKDVEDE
jgi:transcriptional regulator with XRE-family HTH domain